MIRLRPDRIWRESAAAWVTARLVVALGFAAANGVEARATAAAFPQLEQGLLSWDASWYRDLAEFGYSGVPREGLRFFPLFHVAGRGLSWLVGSESLALVLIANIMAFVSLVLLGRLVTETFDDEALARRAIWALALFPAAGALVFGYSESTMLALALAMVLAARRERWLLVAALGLGVGLCRPLGVLIAFVIAPMAATGWSSLTMRVRVERVLAVLAPAVGTASYLVFVHIRFGDWFEPIRIQGEIRKGFQDPVTRLWDAAWAGVTSSQLDAPALGFALVFLVLLVVIYRSQPRGWFLFAAATIVVATSAEVIDSTGRYGLVAFPFAVAIARVCSTERRQHAAVGVGAAALCAITVMTLLGGYIP